MLLGCVAEQSIPGFGSYDTINPKAIALLELCDCVIGLRSEIPGLLVHVTEF